MWEVNRPSRSWLARRRAAWHCLPPPAGCRPRPMSRRRRPGIAPVLRPQAIAVQRHRENPSRLSHVLVNHQEHAQEHQNFSWMPLE
jgi:hypothetical protein